MCTAIFITLKIEGNKSSGAVTDDEADLISHGSNKICRVKTLRLFPSTVAKYVLQIAVVLVSS